jgi:hypothetical protein
LFLQILIFYLASIHVDGFYWKYTLRNRNYCILRPMSQKINWLNLNRSNCLTRSLQYLCLCSLKHLMIDVLNERPHFYHAFLIYLLKSSLRCLFHSFNFLFTVLFNLFELKKWKLLSLIKLIYWLMPSLLALASFHK